MKRPTSLISSIILVAVVIISGGLWFKGLLQSPLFYPDQAAEQIYVKRYLEDHAPDRQEAKALAEAYWARYPDVGSDPYFGRGGTLGLAGAKQHFDSYGKQEGRIWGPAPEPVKNRCNQADIRRPNR